MKKARTIAITGAALAAAVLGLGTWACQKGGTADRRGLGAAVHTVAHLYHCPMHPAYTSDRPGDCPICGMKLVPVESPGPSSAAGEREIAYYRSPMDPKVRSDRPAKDAMGMDFVPVYKDEITGSPAVADRAAVVLSPERRQMLGLRTAPVRRIVLDRTIRTVGRLTPDERRLHHVHTKFDGYIEHLQVDFTGKFVRKGEPLASIYSPELVATQQEYLLAFEAQKQLADSGLPSVAKGSVDLLEAARQRLRQFDVSAADIEAIERTGEVKRTLNLYSDVSGYVTAKMALHGMRVTPADTLFDIADLSHLWAMADVYESDLPLVRLGMSATVTVPYLPGKTWTGLVTNVAPVVDEKTRTIKVRVEVDNAGGELKPEMFSDVVLKAAIGEGLVVPESAVVHSGEHDLVFVDTAGSRLEPRSVQLGARVPEGLQVLSGLAEGESVVTSANFLLDSESSLKAALAALSPPPPAAPVHKESRP